MPKTKCSRNAYEQKVLAQISKNHNTRHMNQHVIEHAVQKYADNKECYCDDYPSTSFKFPSEIDSACANYQTITLAQAYAQGGVRNCQELIITEAIYHEDITDGITYKWQSGLLINNGNTFTIAEKGRVTINIEIANENDIDLGNADGISIFDHSKLINHGTITFSKITAATFACGIDIQESELLNKPTGRILFNGEITDLNKDTLDDAGSQGIFCYKGLLKNEGVITFSKITSSEYSIGIEIDSDGLNKSEIINVGKIEFNDEIKVDNASGYAIYGIFLDGKQSVLTNYGKIIFSKISKSSNETWSNGIYSCVDTNKIINKSTGLIAFNGELPSGDDKSFGIDVLTNTIETDGQITFVNTTLNFFPDLENNSGAITGSGSITYNGNSIYYIMVIVYYDGSS